MKFVVDLDYLNTSVIFHTDLGEDYEGDNLPAEEFWSTLLEDPIRIYLRDSTDIRTLVHECMHCVEYILETRWIDDKNHETWCYLLDYIVGKFCEKVGLILTRKQCTSTTEWTKKKKDLRSRL